MPINVVGIIDKDSAFIDEANPLPTRDAAIDAKLSLDAFGRLRFSQPHTIFDSKQIYDKQPLVWDDAQVSGAGTSSTYNANQASTTLAVSAMTAGVHVRQTFRWLNYQPGKGQLVVYTGVLGTPATGVVREAGLFNDQNGLFFRSGHSSVSVVIRSYVTGVAVETEVPAASWDNPLALDFSKTQIFFIDYEWLGVGSVRFGVFLEGVPVLLHSIQHSNLLSVVYMSTPNLPLRWRIENDGTGGAASCTHICATVISEGGVQDPGMSLSIPRTTALTTQNNSNVYAFIGLRLKTTHLGINVIPRALNLVCTSSTNFAWFLIVDPTIDSTAPTWVNFTNGAVQTAIATVNTNTVSGGTVLASGVAQSTNETTIAISSPTGFILGSNIAGTPQQLWLCVQRLTGTSETFYGSMTWGEL